MKIQVQMQTQQKRSQRGQRAPEAASSGREHPRGVVHAARSATGETGALIRRQSAREARQVRAQRQSRAILRVILRVMRTRLRTPQSALMMLPAPTVVYAMYLWSPVAIVTLGSTGSARLPRSQNCIQMTRFMTCLWTRNVRCARPCLRLSR